MKAICSRKRCVLAFPLVLMILPLATGCGGEAKGTVSGKVTYQGKPLPGGFVTFVPDNGAPVHTDIQSDGTYHIDKAPLGPVKISVQPKSEQEAMQSSRMPRDAKGYGKFQSAMTETKSSIPPKYGTPNESGLTYTVVKGPQQHDIDLK